MIVFLLILGVLILTGNWLYAGAMVLGYILH